MLNRTKLRKVIGSMLLVSISSLGLYGCGNSTPKREINLICWSEYLPQEVLNGFEKETGIKVNVTTYSASDEMLAKVQSSAKGTYDMIIGTSVNTAILSSQGLLAELDYSKIPNYSNINPIFTSTLNDPDNKYSIPYLYTTVVIAVNKDLVQDDIKSYEDLLDSKYEDSMVVIEDSRTVVSIALLAKGYDPNDTSDEALAAAEEYLNALKPNIHAFNGDSPKTLMLNEECAIGLIYGGECALAMDENPSIVGIYPEEGTYFETDMMMKTKDAKNPDDVETFINYLCDAEVGAEIAKAFPYVTPNEGAKAYLDEAYLSNNVKNMPEEEIVKGKATTDLGDDLSKIVDLWTKFKG